ncbi:MAG: arsenite methyltransferase [bacterium]
MEEKEIHRQVRRAYASAVSTLDAGCGCCDRKGVAIQWAGYGSEEIATLPREAVENAFGCGNPLAFADVNPGQTVLDLGCGAGIDLLIASGRVGPNGKVIGVDMTDEMIGAASANIIKAGVSNVEVRKGLIEELPVVDSSVDWVISNCVINLSPDKPKVFSEIARVLRSGGTMQVSDLVARDLPEWVANEPHLYNSCIAGAITEEEYVAGLQEAGMTEVEVVERMAYDALQVREIAKSEVDLDCACGIEVKESEVEKWLDRVKDDLAGRIVSIKIRARKPA